MIFVNSFYFLLQLVTAGSEAIVRHWTINGSSAATAPSSQLHVFSLAANKKSSSQKVIMSHMKYPLIPYTLQILSVAGSSPKVDIFTNYGYKAFSLIVTDSKQ